MNTHRRVLSLLVPTFIGFVCFATPTISHATSWVAAAGASCHAAAASEPIVNGGDGAANPSSSGASVINCPLDPGNTTGSPTVGSAIVEYADYHNSWAMACKVYERLGWTGSLYATDWRYTCSVAGGCDDETSEYTGINYLSWSTSELGVMGTEYRDGNYGFSCYLPPTSGGAESAVITYFTAI